MERNKPTYDEIEKMADEVYEFLVKNGMWYDTSIFYNEKKRTTSIEGDGKQFRVEEDVAPDSALEYYNKDHILSMTFEGSLYHTLNYYFDTDYCDKICEGLAGIFNNYGCYYELGNAWNLSLYLI